MRTDEEDRYRRYRELERKEDDAELGRVIIGVLLGLLFVVALLVVWCVVAGLFAGRR